MGRRTFATSALLVLALMIWLVVMREFRLDDSFITFRYARNVVRSWGLVYNPGDAVLSTTAPLYALLLAVFSVLISDFPLLGGLIGTLAIGVGGGLTVKLLPDYVPLAIRIWAGGIYVLSSLLWLALGMETPIWIALVLAVVYLVSLRRWTLAGFLIGLAVLTRPDAVLPGLLLWLTVLGAAINQWGTRRRWWMPFAGYSLAAGLPVFIFGIWAWATYGSPFPATLAAKNVQAMVGITGFGTFVDSWGGLRMIVDSLLAQSPLYIVMGLLMLAGLSKTLTSPIVIITVWGVLHLLAYVVLGVAPYRWYYVPLLPGVVLLAAMGLCRIDGFFKKRGMTAVRYGTVFLALFPMMAQITSLAQISAYIQHGGPRQTMLPIVDWQAYREAGEWLNANTLPDATIGVSEVGQIGFYADRWMTDYLGLLQPDVAALLARGDLYSWLVGYAPDYLVFQRFGGKVGLALYNYFIEYDPWFAASYREVAKFDDPRYVLGPVVIYQRTTPERELTLLQANVDFGPVRLTGLAIEDGLTVKGGPTRVRLDWQVMGQMPDNMHITLMVTDLPGEPKFDGDYETRHWRETLSTWHTLIFPDETPPREYPLQVSVGPIDNAYIPATVGEMNIPPPA